MKNVVAILLISIPLLCVGQRERKINFPDVDGYQTLKADLHIHTVFSDGSVWPDIRIQEAIKDGLDAISLTEHLEYQPHLEDIPHPDRNRSYIIAEELAKPHDLMVIHGAEITRDLPPGHSNAIFITDANALDVEEPVRAFEIARSQGAFIFWNHPNWINQKEDGKVLVTELHKQLIEKDLLHGLEVVNDITYSDDALEIANTHNLTVIGTSDIHGLVDYQFEIAEGGHRPITLVFANERTKESLKQALFDGRTVTWFNELLIGKQKHLQSLVDASLDITNVSYIGPSSVAIVRIQNNSDASFILQNKSEYDFQSHSDVLHIAPQSSVDVHVMTLEQLSDFGLSFECLNCLIDKRKHLMLDWKLNVE